MSISNQKNSCFGTLPKKIGMFQYEYYVDDGYTGRNFNRRLSAMIADIEAGKIGCVITKDLSRLGKKLYRSRQLY